MPTRPSCCASVGDVTQEGGEAPEPHLAIGAPDADPAEGTEP
jgi:hypothetical protein